MGSDDSGCEHDWVLAEVVASARGADQVTVCRRCGLPGYAAGQAAVRDPRPPLD